MPTLMRRNFREYSQNRVEVRVHDINSSLGWVLIGTETQDQSLGLYESAEPLVVKNLPVKQEMQKILVLSLGPEDSLEW